MDISYLGTSFHGWQVQNNAHTVQEELNNALSTLLQKDIATIGSGRTDAGVHARQQIAHFDGSLPMNEDRFKYRLNGLLPHEISINSIRRVKDDAHARFDAKKRSYEYHLHQYKDPFRKGFSYYYSKKLDLKAIQEGMEIMKTWKNFKAFSKVHTDVNHFDCDIYMMSWTEENGKHLFSVSANRFLRGMVRAMVGTLLGIGEKKLSTNQLVKILEGGNRSAAGRSVPAEGLYLTEVSYPQSVFEI